MMSQASVLPLRLWQIGIPLLSALIGLLAAISPKLGVAGAFAVVYVALVLTNLALGLAVFVALIFLESIGGFGGLSVAKAAGALLFFSWLALVTTNRGQQRGLVREHPVAAVILVLFGTWTAVSAVWAESPAAALDAASRWILNLTMFPIVYAAVRQPRHVQWLFALFVFGALLSAGVGVATGTADTGRLGGSGVNANGLGELLIVAVMLAGALGADPRASVPARAVALVAAALAIGALLATVSRGATIGLLAALVLAPVLIGPGRRAVAVVLVVLATALAASYLVAVAPRGNAQRLTTPDATGSGRTDIWKVGWRMVQANPVVGVGAGNYANSTIHYLLKPGTLTRSDYIVDDPKAAHNVYLQALAELGVVGLGLFLAIVGFALLTLVRAAQAFRSAGERTMELLSRGLLIALAGLLASAFFSTAIYSKQLWLLLALCVALGAMARAHRASASSP